jgi:hypothetical protein
MIEQYIDSVGHAWASVVNLVVRLSLPLGIVLAAAIGSLAIVVAVGARSPQGRRFNVRKLGVDAASWTLIALLVITAWAALGAAHSLAEEDLRWRESKEATSNPVPDAPPVEQYGPSAARLVERSYTRTLTLPPDFLQRLGADGVGVLAPYMTDPTAENVLRLVDTFRRNGKDVLFTREATRIDEEPIPIGRSAVKVNFKRIAGRAYEATFEGKYILKNTLPEAINARMVFPIPGANTVRDVSVVVDGKEVGEPNQSGAYEWKDTVAPGAQREAVCRYRVIGARSWRYDLGSQRRRVEEFHLDATPGGAVKFLRGSLQPSVTDRDSLQWDLTNVMTAQRIAIEFPPDSAATECYLQALTALPVTFLLFLVIALAAIIARGHRPAPANLAIAAIVLALGLGSAPVVSTYLGAIAGLILAPVAGSLGAAALLRGRSIFATPVALIPAAFLSPNHTGLLVLALVTLMIAGAWQFLAARKAPTAVQRRTLPEGA